MPIFLWLVSYCPSFGQKVKYDDLFYLLNTKNYEEAEPFLRSFLNDKKNFDHPNANFQMALIFHDKALKTDIFKAQDLLNSHVDSSLYYYTLAKQLIDEKEVKKNDEFYMEYKQRDVRSGKIMVKVFDIHSEIDKHISTLTERKENVARANDFYHLSAELYRETQASYQQVQNEFDGLKELYLRSGLRNIAMLGNITALYDSFLVNFEKMRQELRKIPKSGYGQKLQKREITDFKTQGMDPVDFLKNDIEVWEFTHWAQAVRKTVTTEVMPLKGILSELDEKLENLLQKVRVDNQEFDGELVSIESAHDVSGLLKFDKDPLPLRLIQLKKEELLYHKSGRLFQRGKLDSTDFESSIQLIEKEIKALSVFDSIVDIITKYDIDENIRNYPAYIDARYEGFKGLDKYLKERLVFAKERKVMLESELEGFLFRNSFMLVRSDTVFINDKVDGFTENYGYHPLFTNELFTSGVKMIENTLQGYFTEVNKERKTDLLYQFQIDSSFQVGHTNLVGYSDTGGQLYYLLYFKDTSEVDALAPLSEDISASNLVSEADTTDVNNDMFWHATVVKLYKVDGPSWIKSIKIPFKPGEILVNQKGELMIQCQSPAIVEESNLSMAVKNVILDKDGNLIPNG